MNYSVFTNEEIGLCILSSYQEETIGGHSFPHSAAVGTSIPFTAGEALLVGRSLIKAAEAIIKAEEERKMSPARRALEAARVGKHA
jgi:hypothetical protein